jgi:hypothetical protein
VLWIRIRKDPKLYAGSGSETGDAPYQKSSKISNLIIMPLKNVNLTFSLKSTWYALKYHENAFFIVGIVKERIFRVGSETGSVTFYLSKRIRIRIHN